MQWQRPMGEQSRDDHDATAQQHLYLIFDDWPWGYSIRKLKLPIRSPHLPSLRPVDQRRLRRPEPRQLKHNRLPPPCICLEAIRSHPLFFAAVGTNIIAAHPRNEPLFAPVPEFIMPIVDVSSMGVWFGPGLLDPAQHPIFITVSDVVFALDMGSFRKLSMDPRCFSRPREWSWCDLPHPPLNSIDVTSFAVDGQTIFVSTESDIFAFDIVSLQWKQSLKCSLPFIGRANYVSALNIFVGLSNAPDAYGHLCFCHELGVDQTVCKQNLFSKDNHVAASLVYLGGSEPWFCLVECVWLEKCDHRLAKCVVDDGIGNCGELDQLKKNVDEGDGSMHECGEQDELGSMQECGEQDELGSMQECGEPEGGSSGWKHFKYGYRLTTFSLSFDNDGDLTTGETCVVQYYKMPENVSVSIYLDPVAFWL